MRSSLPSHLGINLAGASRASARLITPKLIDRINYWWKTRSSSGHLLPKAEILRQTEVELFY